MGLACTGLVWLTACAGEPVQDDEAASDESTGAAQTARASAQPELSLEYRLPTLVGTRVSGDQLWFDLSDALDQATLLLEEVELSTLRRTSDGGLRPVNLATSATLRDDGYTLGITLAQEPVADELYTVRIATRDAQGLHYYELGQVRAVRGTPQHDTDLALDGVFLPRIVQKHAIPGGQTHLEFIGAGNVTVAYGEHPSGAVLPRNAGPLVLRFRSANDQPALIPCANGLPVTPITVRLTPQVPWAQYYTMETGHLSIWCGMAQGNSEVLFVQPPGPFLGGAQYKMELRAATTYGEVNDIVWFLAENPNLKVAVAKIESQMTGNCDNALIASRRRCDLYIPVGGAWAECNASPCVDSAEPGKWSVTTLGDSTRFPFSGDFEDIKAGKVQTYEDAVLANTSRPVSDVVAFYPTPMDHDNGDRAANALKVTGTVTRIVGDGVAHAWPPAAVIGSTVDGVLTEIANALRGNRDDVLSQNGSIVLARDARAGQQRWTLDVAPMRTVNGIPERNWWPIYTSKGGPVWIQLKVEEQPASWTSFQVPIE